MQLKEDHTSPLSNQEFDKLMAGLSFDWPDKIAVAVSGGGDSMALLLLLATWCERNDVALYGLTVDHDLRAASQDEALQVREWFLKANVPHQILKWRGNKPTSNIQSEARKARYQLMGDWCAEQGIKQLFLAHHMEDQAETFLMRLLRGSGVDGLSAMECVADLPVSNLEIQIVRPLLTVNKERLLLCLRDAGQEWISDPSNKNEDFTRVKVRNLLEQSEIDGLNSVKLSKTAQKMGRVRSLLDDLTNQAELDLVRFDVLGYAQIDGNFTENLHEEIALRLLARILKRVSGGAYVPRYEKLLSFYQDLKKDAFSGQTLSGCVIFKNKKSQIIFVREAATVKDDIKITKPKQILWDNRFIVNTNDQQGRVVAFAKIQLIELIKDAPNLKEVIYSQFDDHILRDFVLPTIPCLILEDGKVILPDLLNCENQPSFSVVLKK